MKCFKRIGYLLTFKIVSQMMAYIYRTNFNIITSPGLQKRDALASRPGLSCKTNKYSDGKTEKLSTHEASMMDFLVREARFDLQDLPPVY